jgi:RNA polymerase II subunit A small phosphatase-like protein
MPTKLLILDLDETLVWGTTTPLARVPDSSVGEYSLYRRPGLDEFLLFAFDAFRVGIWTSSSEAYATEVTAGEARTELWQSHSD